MPKIKFNSFPKVLIKNTLNTCFIFHPCGEHFRNRSLGGHPKCQNFSSDIFCPRLTGDFQNIFLISFFHISYAWFILRIAATDSDEGSNAELEYSILSWSPPIAKKFFELEKYSGRLINTISLARQQFDE